jgi:hypothetical protein
MVRRREMSYGKTGQERLRGAFVSIVDGCVVEKGAVFTICVSHSMEE